MLIFDEATSSLDQATAEQFAATVNQLMGKVTMVFITHALPQSLRVDAVVSIGSNQPGAKGTPQMQTANEVQERCQ